MILSKFTEQNKSWDHSSHDQFYNDYMEKSLSKETYDRFERYYVMIDKLIKIEQRNVQLDVADIGCGAGTQCRIWAQKGHRVTGLDVNQPLLELAEKRAKDENLQINFELGSATNLPWKDRSKDICLVPELLEHVEDWRSCLDEFARVLRPGGLLFLTTSNKLCPVQQEFNLPFYSWYPGVLKKHYERLSVTTKPELANFAKYPAVHWFTFFGLRSYLKDRGFQESHDRFDVMDIGNKSQAIKLLVKAIQASSPLRWIAHVATPYTLIVSIKETI